MIWIIVCVTQPLLCVSSSPLFLPLWPSVAVALCALTLRLSFFLLLFRRLRRRRALALRVLRVWGLSCCGARREP